MSRPTSGWSPEAPTGRPEPDRCIGSGPPHLEHDGGPVAGVRASPMPTNRTRRTSSPCPEEEMTTRRRRPLGSDDDDDDGDDSSGGGDGDSSGGGGGGDSSGGGGRDG